MRVGSGVKRLHDVANGARIYRALDPHAGWTRQEMLATQFQRLGHLLAYGLRGSHFYRELYGGLSVSRLALEALPTIDRETMTANFDRLVTDPRIRLADLEIHLRRIKGDDYYLGEYRVLASAGTTGRRGVYIFNREEWSTVLAGALRVGSLMGMPPRLRKRPRVASIGAPDPSHVSYRMATGFGVGRGTLRLEATAGRDELVHSLNRFQPEVISAYPSIAALLAQEQQEGRLKIHPRIVATVAELRTDDMDLQIQQAWQVRPVNTYGLTEVGVLGSECPLRTGIHLFEDLCIVEVVDENRTPLGDGLPGRKLLITSLFNFTQPLIRYELSDMLTIVEDECPCGLPFRLAVGVQGRNDDIVYLPDMAGRPVPLHPIWFVRAMERVSGVKEFRIVHERDGIHVLAVPIRSISLDTLRREVSEKIGEMLRDARVAMPELYVHLVDQIERDRERMGKLKLVESRVNGFRTMSPTLPPQT